jgi:hypothetical protein
MERQRDEHAHDFVDHDRPGVDAAEVMFGFGRAP